MATVAQIAEEVATELGEAYGNPDIALQFERWVADATAEFWDSEEWLFTMGAYTLPAIQGEPSTILPAEVGAVRLVIDTTTGEPLEGTTRETLVRRCADLTDEGEPESWFIEGIDASGLILRLWPVPSADRDYEVQYTKLCPTLDEADDSLPVPVDVVRALKHAVRARYHENADELDHADRAQARYGAALVALKKRYLHNTGVDRKIRFGDLNRTYLPHPVPRVPRSI